jgi:hypothetical protein
MDNSDGFEAVFFENHFENHYLCKLCFYNPL